MDAIRNNISKDRYTKGEYCLTYHHSSFCRSGVCSLGHIHRQSWWWCLYTCAHNCWSEKTHTHWHLPNTVYTCIKVNISLSYQNCMIQHCKFTAYSINLLLNLYMYIHVYIQCFLTLGNCYRYYSLHLFSSDSSSQSYSLLHTSLKSMHFPFLHWNSPLGHLFSVWAVD